MDYFGTKIIINTTLKVCGLIFKKPITPFRHQIRINVPFYDAR